MPMEFVETICPNLTCGLPMWVPKHIYDQAHENPNRWIWCANVHQVHWPDSESDKLRKKLEDEKTTVARRDATIDSQNNYIARLTKKVSYWKGIATRYKKLLG